MVYDDYQNIPDSYKNLWYTMTGWFNFAPLWNNILVLSWATISLSWETEKLIFLDNLKTIYSTTILNQDLIYTEIINTTGTNEQVALVDTYITNHVWWIVWIISTTTTIQTNSCSSTEPTCLPSGCTLIVWTPTSVNQSWVKDASNCWFTCNTNYSWTNCETYTAPIVQWRDIPWTNCTNDDIPIWWKIWAWCNSVLWTTGISTNANVYIWTCYNYTWATTTTNCTPTYLTYTAKENAYNSTYWVDNIWWKLYLWSTLSIECKNPTWWNFANTTASTANCACPTWWHVPTEQDFLNLEIALTCTDYTTDLAWRCAWLGWSWNTLKTTSDNIIQALKIPLAGHRFGTYFYYRGLSATLLSSTEYNSTSARARLLNRNNTSVYRSNGLKATYGFSVRCIKD
jgi:uncharacterized protein (TIGR02145 family)